MTAAIDTTIPTSDVDPFSPEFLADPWPFVTELREMAPVVHLERHDVHAIGRYADVHRALTDWQSLQSAAGVGLSNFNHEKPWRPPSVLLEADPPKHDAPRHVLQEILSPRSLRALEERWRADAHTLVDEVLARGTAFDAVTALAEVFPLRVFPDAVGLGPDGRENLLPYGDFAFNAFGPQEGLVAKAAPTIGPTIEWIGEQCRRENLADGGFGCQIWEASDHGDITPEQAPLMVRSLLTAGVDTTVTGIAAVVHAVATTPGAWERLRAHPELLPRAFEEAVRLASPVQTFFRTTKVPTTIAGITLPADRKVLMFLGAANRDPRRWEHPDAFDLDRDPSGHVGFGMGIHQCVGQHVARLEATAVLGALLERVARIDLTGPVVHHPNNTLRGFESVPVEVTLA
ncbi:cytochrome P450 [Demequina sp. SYSU T00039]|uniref:Cytochrome P450 n=1 Tax=Demequina lignilytica TaxID=3051663 RepID=A0AAW7M7Q2_9MICO|nr:MULTISPECIES: cytochrome P450 [unclassified Demequina]MDN4479166.1 cytochrome P450 [Demequina sp. SYSU T00039-1]MDN4489121.1 cytochrome P450 [Demequina sp. SYSU T00039]